MEPFRGFSSASECIVMCTYDLVTLKIHFYSDYSTIKDFIHMFFYRADIERIPVAHNALLYLYLCLYFRAKQTTLMTPVQIGRNKCTIDHDRILKSPFIKTYLFHALRYHK